MSAQYTLGPWVKALTHKGGDFLILTDAEDPNGKPDKIGLVWRNTGSAKSKGKANASLIAAAPEMLDALERMASWVQAALTCEDWVWDGDQREAAEFELAKAKAVINKAKGK